jgi:hypothetical protein
MALVRMHHDNPAVTGGPVTADVPEEAVERWQRKGWYLKPEDQQKPKPAKKAKAKAAEEAPEEASVPEV